MSQRKELGPPLDSGVPVTGRMVQTYVDGLHDLIDGIQADVESLRQAASTKGSGSTAGDINSTIKPPTLDDTPPGLYDELNPSPPPKYLAPSAKFWLRENYPVAGNDEQSALPCSVLRVSLGAGTILNSENATLFIGLKAQTGSSTSTPWASGTTYGSGTVVGYDDLVYISLQSGNLGHQPDTSPSWWAVVGGDDQHTGTTIRYYQVSALMDQEDVSLGYADVRIPSDLGIQINDLVSVVLVAAWDGLAYAETIYADSPSGRQYVAGSFVNPPERLMMKVETIGGQSRYCIRRNQHHVKVVCTFGYDWDTTEPYNAPNSLNYDKKIEIWSRGAKMDDGTDCAGDHPDDTGAEGWEHQEDKNIRRIITRIARQTKKGIAKADQNRDVTISVMRHKGQKIWMAWRLVDTYGQTGPWNNITPSTLDADGGSDSGTYPGYALVSSAYLPGGASNQWSNAADDPATGSWNADDDVPGTQAKEVTVRARVYLTDTASGTSPVSNASNKHVTLVIKEARPSGKIVRHQKTVDVENDTESPGSETYVDVEYKQKFKHGATCTIKQATVAGNGFSNTSQLSVVFVAGGGSIPTLTPPTISAVTHNQKNTVVDVTLPNEASIGVLQIFAAPTGTTQSPDAAPTSWKKVWVGDVSDDVAAGRFTISQTVGRVGVLKTAFCARTRSRYDASVFSQYSSIYDQGTVPPTDDVAPNVPTIVSAVSYLKDLKGTSRKECDLTVNFTAPGCTAVEVSVQDPDGSVKKRLSVTGTGTESVYWKHKFDYGDALAVTIKGINGTAESAWSSATNTTGGAGSSSLPTQSALAPAITSVTHTKLASVYVITLPSSGGVVYDCVRDLQFWWAPKDTVAPTGQNTPSGSWKKIKTVSVQELAGGTALTIEVPVNRPNGTRKAAVCRLTDAAGRRSDWSNGYDTGTPPDTDDDPPSLPTLGTVTSYLKDVKGTKRKECDLTVPFSDFTGCTKIEVEVSDPDGVVSKTKVVKGATAPKSVYWKHKFDHGDTLYYRWRGQNGTAYSDWSTLDASWPASAPSIVAGSTTGSKPAGPAFTGCVAKKNKANHSVFQLTWASASADAYREIEVESYDADTSTWLPLKTVNIKKRRAAGKASIRVLHNAAYEKPQVRFNLTDCYDQESVDTQGHYYPSDTGTDSTWWATGDGGGGGPGGDGENPISKWPWTFTGLSGYSSGYLVVQGTSGGTARLDVPLHKQKIKMHGDWNFTDSFSGQYFGFLDDDGHNGYVFKIYSGTQGGLYTVNGSGTQTLVGSLRTFTALTLGTDVNFKMEVHRTKVVVIIGPDANRFEWSNIDYRTLGWKAWFSATADNRTYIRSLTVNNAGDFYNALAGANLPQLMDGAGFIDGGAVHATAGGTSVALNTFFVRVGDGVYFDRAQVRGGQLVASLASLPTTDLKAGDEVMYYESSGSGAGKYRIARFYPQGCFDGTNPTSDLWVNYNGDATNSASSASTSTGGSGGSGGTCFTDDTLIRTPGGHKRIGELECGDVILSLNQVTGEEVEDYIVALKDHEADWHLDLGFAGVTEEHLLFGWSSGRPPASCPKHAAGGLSLGCLLYGAGGPVALTKKEVVVGKVNVRAITTAEKDYWVGDGETWVLAHNLKSNDI